MKNLFNVSKFQEHLMILSMNCSIVNCYYFEFFNFHTNIFDINNISLFYNVVESTAIHRDNFVA